MRAYLVEQLRDLISNNQIRKEEAEEILELFDLEVEWKDKSEQLAYDKAQQDVEIALQGEWGE
jgi:ABC-type branched-subunit amino acid transport system ATPase component